MTSKPNGWEFHYSNINRWVIMKNPVGRLDKQQLGSVASIDTHPKWGPIVRAVLGRDEVDATATIRRRKKESRREWLKRCRVASGITDTQEHNAKASIVRNFHFCTSPR
jgi:hypothetical protein